MENVTAKMQELLSKLPRTDTPEFSSRYTPGYSEREVVLSITSASILLALNRAREARELAVSYRKFKVGAAVIALSLGSPRFEIMTGVNVKPDQDSNMNVHAEQSALQKVTDRGYTHIAALALVGETQNDQQSGHDMHTLHPCGLCRAFLSQSEAIDADRTLIVSALPDLKTIEMYDLNQLHQFHSDPSSTELTRFDLPDMEILEPFAPDTDSPIRLMDTPQSLAEERIWDSTVGAFTASWRHRHLNPR